VPAVDTSGYYTFVWYWIFNPGSPYISCYEAYIDSEAVSDDDNAEDTFDASSGSDTATVSQYQTQMPICVSGMEYDAAEIEEFVCSQFQSEVDCDNIEITSVSTSDDGFDLTVLIYHDSASREITSIAWAGATWYKSPFCTDLEQLEGSDGQEVECVNCLDTITYALYTSSSVGNNVQIVMVMVVVLSTLLSKW